IRQRIPDVNSPFEVAIRIYFIKVMLPLKNCICSRTKFHSLTAGDDQTAIRGREHTKGRVLQLACRREVLPFHFAEAVHLENIGAKDEIALNIIVVRQLTSYDISAVLQA